MPEHGDIARAGTQRPACARLGARGPATTAARRPRGHGALAAVGLASAAWVAGVAPAQAADLLPPERAFAYSVQALDASTVEARFAVAPDLAGSECVFSDWGLLVWARERGLDLRPCVGRLLGRQRRDPRAVGLCAAASPEEAEAARAPWR